jgi:hypothetical protein
MYGVFQSSGVLRNGVALGFSLALSACGGGGSSVGVPGVPVIGSVTPGDASATVAFTAPASNGGSSINFYTATCAASSGTVSSSGASSPVVVSGLVNGATYSCSMTASNSVGTSAASTSAMVTPGSSAAATSTAAVLCNVLNSGSQALSYVLANPVNASNSQINDILAFNYSWSCSGGSRSLVANGVPNHPVTGGQFATRISAQSISGSVTTSPAAKSALTVVKLPGFAINGIKMDPGTAGTCTDTASTVSTGCNYAGGNGTWRMEALADPAVSPWRFDFGTDINNGHTQPNGQYHYHGMPNQLLTSLNSASATSMTLVGWAADGFPIYANLGFSSAANAASALKEMKGSYRVKAAPDANRPATSFFPMGHFQQDWEYVAGLGDLDECNGRMGVTPEFPQGIYHYYITKTYPFIQRCVKGSPASWASLP